MKYEEQIIEGRNAVLEAFRAGRPIDRLFVLDGCQDGPVRTIVRESRKHDVILKFTDRESLDRVREIWIWRRPLQDFRSEKRR